MCYFPSRGLEALLRDQKLGGISLKRVRGTKLKTTKEKVIGRREVLAFYICLLADLHQPFYVGRREDQGGNRIQVEWFEEEMTLHKLWDEAIIESTNLSCTEFTTFLAHIPKGKSDEWSESTYLDWAKESKAIHDQVYDFGSQRSSYFLNVAEPPKPGYDYRPDVRPIVRLRL